jgi:hypothetical protein
MKRLNGVMGGILVAGFFGFFTSGPAVAGDVVSSQQILEALTAQTKAPSVVDRLKFTRSLTFDDRNYAVASAQSTDGLPLSVGERHRLAPVMTCAVAR